MAPSHNTLHLKVAGRQCHHRHHCPCTGRHPCASSVCDSHPHCSTLDEATVTPRRLQSYCTSRSRHHNPASAATADPHARARAPAVRPPDLGGPGPHSWPSATTTMKVVDTGEHPQRNGAAAPAASHPSQGNKPHLRRPLLPPTGLPVGPSGGGATEEGAGESRRQLWFRGSPGRGRRERGSIASPPLRMTVES